MAYIPAPGTSQPIAISTTSAQTTAIYGATVYITPTVDCFVREGSNPTALSNGTDHFLVANCTQGYEMRTPGNKLAFIVASGGGTVYVSVAA